MLVKNCDIELLEQSSRVTLCWCSSAIEATSGKWAADSLDDGESGDDELEK